MRVWSQRLHKRLRPLRLVQSPADGLLLARMAIFAFVSPLLARYPLPQLQRLLEPRGVLGPADPMQVRKISELGIALVQAGRPLLRVSCLTQGLTLYYFLRRAGMEVALCFGMGRQGEGYSGHCWLIADGEPYLEPHDPRPLYREFYRFPAGAVVPGNVVEVG